MQTATRLCISTEEVTVLVATASSASSDAARDKKKIHLTPSSAFVRRQGDAAHPDDELSPLD